MVHISVFFVKENPRSVLTSRKLFKFWACSNSADHLACSLTVFGSNCHNYGALFSEGKIVPCLKSRKLLECMSCYTVSIWEGRKIVSLLFDEAVLILRSCEFFFWINIAACSVLCAPSSLWCSGSVLFREGNFSTWKLMKLLEFWAMAILFNGAKMQLACTIDS